MGIHIRHSAYKREKYTFINASIKVITLRMDNTNINVPVKSIERYIYVNDSFLSHVTNLNNNYIVSNSDVSYSIQVWHQVTASSIFKKKNILWYGDYSSDM